MSKTIGQWRCPHCGHKTSTSITAINKHLEVCKNKESMTQPSKTTPLQEAIKNITHSISINNDGLQTEFSVERRQLYNSIKLMLETLQAKEQQLLSDAFDAGATSVYRSVQPEGPCGFDTAQHTNDKTEFLNQFKTEI